MNSSEKRKCFNCRHFYEEINGKSNLVCQRDKDGFPLLKVCDNFLDSFASKSRKKLIITKIYPVTSDNIKAYEIAFMSFSSPLNWKYIERSAIPVFEYALSLNPAAIDLITPTSKVIQFLNLDSDRGINIFLNWSKPKFKNIFIPQKLPTNPIKIKRSSKTDNFAQNRQLKCKRPPCFLAGLLPVILKSVKFFLGLLLLAFLLPILIILGLLYLLLVIYALKALQKITGKTYSFKDYELSEKIQAIMAVFLLSGYDIYCEKESSIESYRIVEETASQDNFLAPPLDKIPFLVFKHLNITNKYKWDICYDLTAKVNDFQSNKGNLLIIANNENTPISILENLAYWSKDKEILKAIARNPNTPTSLLVNLAGDYLEEIGKNPVLDLILLEDLELNFIQNIYEKHFKSDPFKIEKYFFPDWFLRLAVSHRNYDIRELVARNKYSQKFLTYLVNDDESLKFTLASRPYTLPPLVRKQLLNDPNPFLRSKMIENKTTPFFLVYKYLFDPDEMVREAARDRLGLSPLEKLPFLIGLIVTLTRLAGEFL